MSRVHRPKPLQARPLCWTLQEDFDPLARLAEDPHRDPVQIARILSKMTIPFNTQSGHFAQIVIQRSGDAFRDGHAAVQVSFHFDFSLEYTL